MADVDPAGCRENQPERQCCLVKCAAPTPSWEREVYTALCIRTFQNPGPSFSSDLTDLLCLDLRRLLAWLCVFISGTFMEDFLCARQRARGFTRCNGSDPKNNHTRETLSTFPTSSRIHEQVLLAPLLTCILTPSSGNPLVEAIVLSYRLGFGPL